MLSPKKTIWGILGACFLAFFAVTEVKALTTSFEPGEGYTTATDLNGQEGWIGYGGSNSPTVDSNFPHTGYNEIMFNVTYGYSTGDITRHYFATSTAYKQCIAFYPTTNNFTIHPGFISFYKTGGGVSVTIKLTSKAYLWNGSSYNATFADLTANAWQNICLEYNDTTDVATSTLTYNGTTYTDHAHYNMGTMDQFRIEGGESSVNDGQQWYFVDSLDDEELEYAPDEAFTKLKFDFPNEDGEYSNSEWNDWEFLYDLDNSDVGEVGNLILVVSQDIYNNTFTDYDFISTTTELTNWVINRGNDFPDGDVYSKAKLVKIDSADDCDTGVEETCVWTTVYETEVRHWIASTTGYVKDNDPYDRPSGFYPASSTAEDLEDKGFLDALMNTLYNIFPLSLMHDIYSTMVSMKRDPEVEPSVLSLQDILPDEGDAIIGSTTIPILSANLIKSNLPEWDTVIFPFMEKVVYMIGFIFLIFIIWPKAQTLNLGGHEKVESTLAGRDSVQSQANYTKFLEFKKKNKL